MMAAFRKFIASLKLASLLKRKDGSNAVEYALIMSLVAISIVAGVITVSTELGGFFTSMSTCLNDTSNCSSSTFLDNGGGSDDDEDGNDDDKD